jgi:ribonucleotide reductase alpha subunit
MEPNTPQTTLVTPPRPAEALSVRRLFTRPGVHPFDTVEWETRTAAVGSFRQEDVEFPKSWSQNATNIVAQKYFRGQLNSPARERSVKQMISRVAGTISDWGRSRGYFASEEDGDAFEAELTHILLNQIAAFNSPVWFNVGFEESPQCSACMPYHQMVSTPDGMVPIGELVDGDQVGREVYDANGVTRIVAVKSNGRKQVFRVTLRNGQRIEATGDHVVKAVEERRTAPAWLRVDELTLGMRMHLHPHRAKVDQRVAVPAGAFDGHEPSIDGADEVAVAEAALAGWLQADGYVSVTQGGSGRMPSIEFIVADADERAWVLEHLDVVFPDVRRRERSVAIQDASLDVRRIHLYGEVLRDFVERWGLLARGTEIRVPSQLWTASHEEICAYLQSIFQADGYVTVQREAGSERARIGFAVIGERWAEDVQLLLNVIGIYSRRTRKREARADRHDMHEVAISIGSERARFGELVGFPGRKKSDAVLSSLLLHGWKRCPDLREEEIVSIEAVGIQEVYDIQTESGEYLSNNVAVHNCFILSVEDTMESILDWNTREGRIFRGGSGSGINLSNIRGSMEPLAKGGTASGPVSFMRGADSWAGTIKSGGKTRRAAKMVVLDVDHPDIREFIWCKAKEEDKAAALRDAGFDMSIDGDGFHSIQYQNANNSVRVTDEFLHAVEDDADWHLIARTTGEPVGEPIKARELMREIAEAAWRCADPGVQYDTTINQWHTSPNSGRINASNPCFPGDARVHTTKGLIAFDELYERWQGGETDIEVYTHRGTAGENGSAPRAKGEGVLASRPVRVMRTGVKPIVRLRFANGSELRCTPNHKLWTLNRGYVAAEELTSEDRVLLNDAPTPATAAAWELPLKVHAKAKSFSRGGTVTYQELPERWSEGLGELLGHLVGDGWMTDVQTGWVYGLDDVGDGLPQSHAELIRELVGGVSEQIMDNATLQLRVGSEAVRELFRGLGVTTARAHLKRVPEAVFTAPVEVQAAFLRGLFGADGCVSRRSGNRGYHYVGLGSRSEALLKDVDRLLNSFGVRGRIYRLTEARDSGFSYERKLGTTVEYRSRPGFDLRVTGSDVERFADAIGFSTPRKNAALTTMLAETRRFATKSDTTLVAREDDGQEAVYNLTEPLHHSYIVDSVVVANCSEYMSVDDSACNLASLNLMKFRRPDGSFDVEMFQHTVDIVLLAQEIVVSPSSYPTKEIGDNARAFRQLGLGYANLGAFLMANGFAYDSDEGRGAAAAITALMTGRAYAQSARIAAAMGPYDRYAENREAHNNVMRMHRDAAYAVPDRAVVDEPLLAAARETWNEAVALGELYGYRNAQASVLAPTGTISFLMDCDTTGIEPDFSLVKYKELVGGGNMVIANRTVPMALRTLGYGESAIAQIEAYVAEHGTIVGAPGLSAEHLPVFDVAVGERAISHAGHIKMMGAVQPFLSGAISKTVNMPQAATVDDIAEAYIQAWRLGVKALAIYRDGSKTAQALRTDAQEVKEVNAKVEAALSAGEEIFTQSEVDELITVAVEKAVARAKAREDEPLRKRMPRERKSLTHKFSLGGHEGYITAGMYDDGTVGEIFLTDIGKEGSTLRGMMNSFATAISISLQYGVPLETLVRKFAYMRFEPEGITTNPEIPFAKSMPDYIMRWLASRFLDADVQEELGILTPEVRAKKIGEDAVSGASGGSSKPAGGNGAPKALAPAPAPAPQAPASALTDTPPVVPARLMGLDLGPACNQCGGMMQRTGSCYTCSSCGNNTGCG